MNDGSLIFDTLIDTDGIEEGINDINDMFGDLVKANVLGNFLTDAMQTAGTKLFDFVKKGRDLASDLQEVQNVVDTTFGDGAEQIYKWADAAAESFGMSSLQAQDFNGTLGAMLKSMGLADDAVMQMSTDMVGLAGDMASFYNLDVSAAFDKIRAGISGETEPLKQLGINMSVANLEAFALAEGIETAYSAMTQAEQATLRYNYLMSVTADAQGDFAKTSESFANQQRIAKLTVENLSATLGEQLLPALNDGIGLAIDELPKIEPMVEDIGKAAADTISFIIDNKDSVVTAMTAGTAAIVTYEAVTKGATIAQKALNAATALNPYAFVAGAAVAGVVALISYADSISDIGERYKGMAEQSVKAAEEQAEAITVLEDELEAVRLKIEEINTADGLSITEAEDLANLELENAKLSTQLEIEKEILKTKQAQAQEDTYNALAGGNTAVGSVAYVNDQFEQYKYWEEEKRKFEEYIAEGGEDWEIEQWETQRREAEKTASQYKLAALEGYQAMDEIASGLDLTIEKNKEAKEAVDELSKAFLGYLGIAQGLEEEANAAVETVNVINPQQVYSNAKAAEYKKKAMYGDDETKQIIDNTKTEQLKKQWEELEFQYAKGEIGTEKDLYNQKKQVWDKFGDENIQEHRSYYIDLLGMLDNFKAEEIAAEEKAAAERKKLAEKAAAEEEKAIRDKWDNINRLNQMGFITDEEAMKRRKQFIADYYPEYSAEAHDYYKQIYDDENAIVEEGLKKQEEIVDDGLNDILDAHRKAYDELNRQRESYRNKLMAVGGDLFSVDVSKDKNGNEVTTYAVNNLDEQLRKMKEYHRQVSALKQQGASAGLLEELTSLGDEESAQFAKYLSGMSATEFAKINDLYNEKQKLADELAGDLYKSEAQDITDSMTTALTDLATSAYSYGASAAEQFSAGFSAAANELGFGALYNQIQAAGANRNYENYITVAQNENQTIDINVDVTGKSTITLDGKVLGENVTNYQSQETRKKGK